MKFYSYNNNVEFYVNQQLVSNSVIITVLNPSNDDMEFVKDFVKNNPDKCTNNSYLTLVKGSRKKFIKNRTNNRLLERAHKPIYFYTPQVSFNPETIIINSPNTETINTESNKNQSLNVDSIEIMENFKKQTSILIGLNIGDKLYVYNDELYTDQSYNRFSRMFKNMFWSGYNRNMVIDKLEKIFNINIDKNYDPSYLINLRLGLTNLIETYIDDESIKSRLFNLVNKLY
jgi:hypothetical protein